MAPKRGRAKTTAVTGPINVVVDLSHHNETVDFAKMKAAVIVGVIHKATQGLTYVDDTYANRRAQALECGLLWGGYRFGVGGDGSDQAPHRVDGVGLRDRNKFNGSLAQLKRLWGVAKSR